MDSDDQDSRFGLDEAKDLVEGSLDDTAVPADCRYTEDASGGELLVTDF